MGNQDHVCEDETNFENTFRDNSNFETPKLTRTHLINDTREEISSKTLFVESTHKLYQDTKLYERDTQCGIGCFHPRWFQVFASKKTFVCIYSLAGMMIMALSTYYIGIMTTTEKAYGMSSRSSGLITGAWDIGLLLTNLGITYVAGKGHRTRWIACGIFLVSITSFMRVIPFLVFGPGENVKLYTKEYQDTSNFYGNESTFSNLTGNTTNLKKLSTNINCKEKEDYSTELIFYVLWTCQFLSGAGSAIYWTLGATYLDDNVRKNIVPILLAVIHFIRFLGPAVGFWLSSCVLKIYVDPKLTPIIRKDDPRWVGAWWLGWYPIAIICFGFAVLLSMFPWSLPRAAARKQNASLPAKRSFSDFKESLIRLAKNKILVFNSLSSVSFMLGVLAYWSFMPKYMESQFRLTSAQSNFITGTIGIVCNSFGVLLAGCIITRFKPAPRTLAGWNVFVEILDIIGSLSYIFLSCPQQQHHGHWNTNNSWNLTETCNANLGCGTDIQYAPVCDISTGLAYYSSCHAGCTASYMFSNKTQEYSGCSCVPGGKVIDGLCPVDCSVRILSFILIMGTLAFTKSTGRAANILVQFRAVEERDKSLSIGVTESLVALLAFMPAPILYGTIMDWTCIVWGDVCGKSGNCWLYDSQKLRVVYNLTAATFFLIGTVLDIFVWYHVKGLKIYDEDFVKDDDELEVKTPIAIRSDEKDLKDM